MRANPRVTPEPRFAAAIALLHPDGVEREAFDVVVVEDATPAAERQLRLELRPDGVAYLRVGRRARSLAARAGLEAGPPMLEVGGMLVPVERAAVRWALRARPTRRSGLAARVPTRVLAVAARGLVARRRDSRPLADWLHRRGAGTSVVVSGETAFLVGEGGVTLAARVEGGTGGRTAAERRALVELGGPARAAGAAVPVPVGGSELAGASLLVTTGVPGAPASWLIARRPRSRRLLVERLAGWLERWNAATAVESTLTPPFLEEALLAPARMLGLAASYVTALERLAAAANGRRVKFVAAHNDLTTANVLVSGDSYGVVDWESAEPEGLPIGDLVYMVADAEAAAGRFADRPGAFVASLDRQAEHEARLTRALELERAVADVCFHACWLRHAANERVSGGGQGRPFLELVRTIGSRRIRLPEAP